MLGKEDTFLQAYVASNLLFQLIFVFSFHALPYTKTKEKEKVVEVLNVINDPKCNKVLNVITFCPKCNKVLNVITICPKCNKLLSCQLQQLLE